MLPHREAFFGGAAGGGKSDALLMAALQYVDVPGYAALLIRRTFPELDQPGGLLDRSRDWLMNTEAKYNSQKKMWTFPSGAKLAFGYLEIEKHKYQYQGSEFQFIGFDELTAHEMTNYTYLFSRCRKTQNIPVPLRIRSASNPGNIGHEWVKERFISNTEDNGTKFVSAKIQDNPHLSQEEYLEFMSHLDYDTRMQLLHGDWDHVTSGDIFKRQWFKYFDQDEEFYYLGTSRRPVPKNKCWRFGAVDLAISLKASADYTVIGVFDVTENGEIIVVEILRERMDAPTIQETAENMYTRFNLDFLLSEKVQWQEALIHYLRRKGLAVKAYMPKGDKASRARAASIRYEAGMVFHPKSAPWFEAFETELVMFTGDDKQDPHDDQVDVISMACNQVGKIHGDPEWWNNEDIESDVASGLKALGLNEAQISQVMGTEQVQYDNELVTQSVDTFERSMWESDDDW